MNRTHHRVMEAAAILLAAGANVAGQPVAGGQPLFVCGFEPPAYALKPLANQQDWYVLPPLTPPESAMVVSGKGVTGAGLQSARFDAQPLGCVSAEWLHKIAPQTWTSEPLVNVEWDMSLLPADGPSSGWGVWLYGPKGASLAGMFIEGAGTVSYWTSGPTGVMTGTQVERGTWNHFMISLDYTAGMAGFYVNGAPIEQNGDMVEAPALVPGGHPATFSFAVAGPGHDAALLDNVSVMLIEMGCYANCDGSTEPPILNVNDFTCFQAQFVYGQALPTPEQVTCYANCDGSIEPPILTVGDLICFLNRFAGCR